MKITGSIKNPYIIKMTVAIQSVKPLTKAKEEAG